MTAVAAPAAKKSNTGMIVLGVIVLVLLVVGGVWLFRRQKRSALVKAVIKKSPSLKEEMLKDKSIAELEEMLK